eukprot:CCRYP_015211-RA/>CCRYP_015211-RA protein AED:0.06 eAED:0.06 QI:125/1/1/1/1/1/2/494/210
MSCLCIGGVCIPYSAILPLLLVGLQWLAAKLARLGLLPDWVGKKLGVSPSGKISSNSSTATSCCNSNNKSNCCPTTESSITEATTSTDSEHETTDQPPPIVHITSLSQWQSLLASCQKNNAALIVKFTADWCKPCKQIQPCYVDLSSKYCSRCKFVTVDVDGEDCDVLSSQQRIAMMPTFLCFRDGVEVGRMSGGNSEEKLMEWVGEMCR